MDVLDRLDRLGPLNKDDAALKIVREPARLGSPSPREHLWHPAETAKYASFGSLRRSWVLRGPDRNSDPF